MSTLNTPIAGIGISLAYNLGGSSTYSTFAQLMDDCAFSGFETTVIPVPTLATQTLVKVAGRTDNGTFNGSMYLVTADSGAAEILALSTSRQTVAWRLQLPDGTSPTTGSFFAFSGFVSSLTPGNFTGEGAATYEFEIAISGAVSFTLGS